jgi:protoporphyrinogen oxidase
MGIGTIPEKLEAFCGAENIRKNAKVTRIFHNKQRISGVEINSSEKVQTDFVISTLPLDRFLHTLEPRPEQEILRLSKNLRYRSILLIAFFLRKPLVSENASIYFPDSEIPFTRIHEPKNRSPKMSPPDKTSLVVEIPCQIEDSIWKSNDETLVTLIRTKLIQAGLITKQEIIDCVIQRMPYAYPILEKDFEEKIRHINAYLGCFTNLRLSGRNGRFVYGHIHDMMDMGREIIEEYRTKKCQDLLP